MGGFFRRVMLLAALLAWAAAARAQSINGHYSSAPLQTVLSDIERQSGFTFMYDLADINGRTVTGDFKGTAFRTALDKVLGPDLQFFIKGKIVTVSRRVQAPVPARNVSSGEQKPVVVSGVVSDSRGPMAGVVIIPEGNLAKGTLTDAAGRFFISVKPGTELKFSTIGYGDELRVVNAAGTMDVLMKEEATALGEVLVVGYGVQRKESSVGAISQISTEAVVNTGLTNITQAMAGKLSGVLTMQSSGRPGQNDAAILVRGVSSWNGSSPLCMVDGVERSFTDIDPNEIASISVLKDASATAVFGAKGANGVIIVTTRSGEKGKPKMKLSVNHGFLFPALLPKHQSSYDTALAYNVAMMNQQNYGTMFSQEDLDQYRNPSDRFKELQYPDNDWYDIMMKKIAHTTDANFNISGGSEKARYFMSMGYKHEGSIFRTFQDFDKVTYKYDRLNYRINLDFDLTSTTTLSYKVGGDVGIKLNPDSSPVRAMFSGTTIAFPAYYPEWVLEEIPDWDYPDASGKRLVTSTRSKLSSYYGNPYNDLNIASYDQTTSAKLYTDLILRQGLDFITDGLSLDGKFSFSTGMTRDSESVSRTTETYYLDWDYYEAGLVNPWVCSTTSTSVVENLPYSAAQGGITATSYSLYWEGSVNYDRTFMNHHLTGLALFNQKESRSSVDFPYRNQGLVGRITYDYARKYLFEGNVGYTGSEQFAPANRYGFFPSVAVGYVMSSEKWWKESLPWWSKFKLRYSDGYVGNDQVAGNARWLYFSSYTAISTGIVMDEVGNNTAKWEVAHKRDFGIESAWFDNKLSMSLDLFSEHRSDMLVNPVVPYVTGTKYKMVNKGEMKKHGCEVEFGWKDKLPNGIRYNLSAMYSFNENRIINYEDPPYLPEYQKTAGKPYMGQQNGITGVDGGYFRDADDIHIYPAYSDNWTYVPEGGYKYVDYCLDGSINANDLHSVLGSQYPSTLFSFGGGLKYKGWEFSVLFYGNMGKWVNYNGSFEVDFVKSELHLSASQAGYWRPDNQNANHATMVYNGAAGHPMYSWAGIAQGETVTMGLVGRTWRNADYFTLRDLYLGYSINTRKLKETLGVASLNFYLTGNNLIYFTSLIEGNPEQPVFTTGQYPLMKTVQLGVKVGF